MQWHGSVIPALLCQDGRWRQENCPKAVWLATWSMWESQERPCLWRFSSDPHTLPEYECLELALETTLASESYSHLRLPPECCKQRWVPPWPSKSVFFKKLHVCMLYLYDSPVLHSPSNFKLKKDCSYYSCNDLQSLFYLLLEILWHIHLVFFACMCVHMYNMGLLPLEVFTAKTPVHKSAVWECFRESYRELHNILFLKCIKIILLPSPSHTQMRAVLLLTALSHYKFLQSWEQEGGEHGPLQL